MFGDAVGNSWISAQGRAVEWKPNGSGRKSTDASECAYWRRAKVFKVTCTRRAITARGEQRGQAKERNVGGRQNMLGVGVGNLTPEVMRGATFRAQARQGRKAEIAADAQPNRELVNKGREPNSALSPGFCDLTRARQLPTLVYLGRRYSRIVQGYADHLVLLLDGIEGLGEATNYCTTARDSTILRI